MIKKLRSKASQAGTIALGLALLSGPAFADGLDMFQPVAGDKSISMLLGKVFGQLFGGSEVPLQAAFQKYNGVALLLGGIITLYVLVAGTMMTAHDGENMGRKWSSVWIPIRTAIATAMLTPITGGSAAGYCAAQLLMAWVTTQSVGLADDVWTGYATSNFSQQGMTPQTQLPAVDELAAAVLKSQVCMLGANSVARADASSGSLLKPDFSATDLPNGSGRAYGSASMGSAVCGSVRYTATVDANPQGQNIVSGGDLNSSFVTSFFGLDAMTGKAAALRGYHIQAVSKLESDLQPIAQAIVDGKSVDPSAYTAAITNYQNSIGRAAAQLMGSEAAFAEVADSASRDGWVTAGSWFSKASAMQDAASRAAAAVPTTTAPQSLGLIQADIDKEYAVLDAFHKKASGWGLNDPAAHDDTSSGPLGELLHFVGQKFNSGIYSLLRVNPNRNGLMSVKDIGDGLESTGNAILVVGLGASFTAEMGTGAAQGLSLGIIQKPLATLTALNTIIMTVSGLVLVLGSFMGTILPNLPLLLYFGAVIGWVLLVCEAMVAAPLWILMHLRPDGDGATAGNQQGYMLLASLALRPVLIVFGLIFSFCVLDPVLQLFNSLFLPSFQSAMSESFVGISATITMAGLYFGAIFKIMTTIFGFMHKIGDQVLRWMGGGHEQLGESASAIAEGGRGGAFFALNNTQKGSPGGAPRGAAGGRPDSAGGGRGAGAASDLMGGGPMPEKRQNASAGESDSMGVSGGSARGGSSPSSSGGDGPMPEKQFVDNPTSRSASGDSFGSSASGSGTRSAKTAAEAWASESVEPGPGFSRRARGQVVEQGKAPFRNEEGAAESPFVKLRQPNGETSTHWGKGLPGALRLAGVKTGDYAELAQMKAQESADGKSAPRAWIASKFDGASEGNEAFA
ncbi:DotA/TraY family protein [Caballeronia sp. BCC1704]|uniref:DotA/TraY family protein n=1 Tax=Caballeronia sp. BCC1704 TaxID=2676300 RepID=UPI00158CB3C8|nr:DotA/TraY family protein [Caballeronia sp. BCC1704]